MSIQCLSLSPKFADLRIFRQARPKKRQGRLCMGPMINVVSNKRWRKTRSMRSHVSATFIVVFYKHGCLFSWPTPEMVNVVTDNSLHMAQMRLVQVPFTLIVRLALYAACVTKHDSRSDVRPCSVCQDGKHYATSSDISNLVVDGHDVRRSKAQKCFQLFSTSLQTFMRLRAVPNHLDTIHNALQKCY